MATHLDFNKAVLETANRVIRAETDQEHLEVHIVSIQTDKKTISEEMLPELITNRVLEIVRQAVEPLIQQNKGREYVPDIDDLYKTKLFLLLQEKLGLHPYQ